MTHFALYVYFILILVLFENFFSLSLSMWQRWQQRELKRQNSILWPVKYFNISESKANFICFVSFDFDSVSFHFLDIFLVLLLMFRLKYICAVVRKCEWVCEFVLFFSHYIFTYISAINSVWYRNVWGGWNKNENWSYVLECQICREKMV